MTASPEPDAEELCARLRAHLAEVLRLLGQPLPVAQSSLLSFEQVSRTRRQAMRAQRRNKRLAVSP